MEKNMDNENDELQWEIYCKNVYSKDVFGKLMYFETEFFCESCKESKSEMCFM